MIFSSDSAVTLIHAVQACFVGLIRVPQTASRAAQDQRFMSFPQIGRPLRFGCFPAMWNGYFAQSKTKDLAADPLAESCDL